MPSQKTYNKSLTVNMVDVEEDMKENIMTTFKGKLDFNHDSSVEPKYKPKQPLGPVPIINPAPMAASEPLAEKETYPGCAEGTPPSPPLSVRAEPVDLSLDGFAVGEGMVIYKSMEPVPVVGSKRKADEPAVAKTPAGDMAAQPEAAATAGARKEAAAPAKKAKATAEEAEAAEAAKAAAKAAAKEKAAEAMTAKAAAVEILFQQRVVSAARWIASCPHLSFSPCPPCAGVHRRHPQGPQAAIRPQAGREGEQCHRQPRPHPELEVPCVRRGGRRRARGLRGLGGQDRWLRG